jgi:NAD(P)-dependent dehydrogenase (short-subunit alcohol dehydrogenase family)
MELSGKRCVVTGAAGGIGLALAKALLGAEAEHVVLMDLDSERLATAAAGLGERASTVAGDVSDETVLLQAVDASGGEVDVFCANAGVGTGRGFGEPDEWALAMKVNFEAHVTAARLLLPGWLERGSGCFVATASAAGLLTQIGSAPYAVSKHAAVAFAEWLSVTYGDKGLHVSCLCPMGVNTNLLNAGIEAGELSTNVVAAAGAVLEPDEVAERVIEALRDERFLVLPHPEVGEFLRRKATDPDRWLAGMRRLQAQVEGA